MKFEENIYSVMTGGIKGHAKHLRLIFQVLGRLHRFLNKRVIRSELRLWVECHGGCELEEGKCGSRESNWKRIVKSITFSRVATC